jgi:hypothetical protein
MTDRPPPPPGPDQDPGAAGISIGWKACHCGNRAVVVTFGPAGGFYCADHSPYPLLLGAKAAPPGPDRAAMLADARSMRDGSDATDRLVSYVEALAAECGRLEMRSTLAVALLAEIGAEHEGDCYCEPSDPNTGDEAFVCLVCHARRFAELALDPDPAPEAAP